MRIEAAFDEDWRLARSLRDALPVTSEGAVAFALISLGREDTFGDDARD